MKTTKFQCVYGPPNFIVHVLKNTHIYIYVCILIFSLSWKELWRGLDPCNFLCSKGANGCLILSNCSLLKKVKLLSGYTEKLICSQKVQCGSGIVSLYRVNLIPFSGELQVLKLEQNFRDAYISRKLQLQLFYSPSEESSGPDYSWDFVIAL